MDCENHLKKQIKKVAETVKHYVKKPHVNKKPLARRLNFDQTPFSHSTSKLDQKNAHRKTTRSPFRSNACFDVTKITTPI